MATLTTSYQKIGTSGTVSFGGASAYLELYAKYNSQSIPNNTTEWRIYARLVVNSGYIGEYTGATLSLSGDGISSSQNLGTGNFRTQDLGDAVNGTVTHNTDGTKSVSASATVTFRAWSKSITVSGSATLPTIPRYANITSFTVSKRDETSVKYNFTADASINYAKYSTDNGSTWHDLPTSNVVSGLSANTTYNFKLQVRRTDSGLWTTSNTVQQTTYNYPYCTSSPNLILGNNLHLTFYNPLSRSIRIYIIGADGTEYGGDTITGTSIDGYAGTGWLNWWYSTIPNAKSGKYQVKVVYGNIIRTRNNGNTYTIKGTETPIFSNFEYYDNDGTITPLTNDNQILVNGNSDCIFTISVANKAEGQKSATITKYICQWGTGSSEVAYSSTEDVSQHVYDNTGGVLKVTAVDSRGLTTTVTKNITYVPYVSAVINNVETQRKDGVDAKTYLKAKFTIYNGSWNASDNESFINRLKYVGYSVYINNEWSQYYDITQDVLNNASISTSGNTKSYSVDFNDEIELHANGSSGGFTVGAEYQIRFLIKDGNETVVFTPYSYQALYDTDVSDGTVAICLHKDYNGIYHLGLNGMSDDNWLISIDGVGIIRKKT